MTASEIEDNGRLDSLNEDGSSVRLMLHHHNEQHFARPSKPQKWRAHVRYCVSVLVIVIFGVITTTLVFDLVRHNNTTTADLTCPSPPKLEATNCGNSASEARARGCRFDIMSFSWLPAACFDDELTSEFSQLRAWKWYANPKNIDMAVSRDVVELGEHQRLWVSAEYHFFHCTFMWRKLHRAAMGLRQMDSYIYNYSHTEHCEHMLQHPVSATTVDSFIFRKYPSCLPAVAGLGSV